MKKLSQYQIRLAKLRAESGLSETEIAKLMGKAHKTIRNDFVRIREVLEIPTFEAAWKKYKEQNHDLFYQV